MLMSSRILGDQVGSTAPVFLAFLAVHVLAGLTAVVTGAIAALARKGSPRHVRAGRWYYWAITVRLRHRYGTGRDALAAGLLPVHHRRGGVHRRDHRLPASPPPSSR